MRNRSRALPLFLSISLVLGLLPLHSIAALAEDGTAIESGMVAVEEGPAEDALSNNERDNSVEASAIGNETTATEEGSPDVPIDDVTEADSTSDSVQPTDSEDNVTSDSDAVEEDPASVENASSEDEAIGTNNEEGVIINDDPALPADEHLVRYAPGYEDYSASSEAPDDAELTLVAMSQQSFPDMPVRNSIWPIESDGAICYLVENASGNMDVRKYDLQTESVTTLASNLETTARACFVKGDTLFYMKSKFTRTVCKLNLVTGVNEELFSFKMQVYYSGTCLGVDHNENIFIADSSSFIIFNRNGDRLYEAEEPYIMEFVGFDDTNGNFYYMGNYNWRYWGYDHAMSSLKVGNFDGTNVVYNDNPITIFFQTGFSTHFGCAEMLPGGYIADMSPFQGNELAILDSSRIDQADVTETTTSISLVDSGVSVTSVALPDEDVVFGTHARPSAYENYSDVAFVGSGCAYLADSDLLAVATGSNRVTCYTLHGGAIQGVTQVSGDIYKVMAVGDEVVLLEKTAAGDLMLERLSVREATRITLDGPSSLEVGASADYLASVDSDFAPAISFSSSDPRVLTIDGAGHAATWAAGTVTVYARTDTGLSTSKTVRVSGGGTSKQLPDVTPASGASVNNWNFNNYSTSGSVVSSYISETSSGLMRVQARAKDVLVEYYDRSGKLKSTKTITNELPLFGGFYAGSGSYYLVFGQSNTGESDSVNVMRVVRYDTSWKKQASCNISAINTYYPFASGSLRMTETGGTLYIHTCHTMYNDGDGFHHQANMTFAINESDMTLADSYTDVMNLSYGYVSHSFNQFVQTDGEYLYRVDQGDYYPRGITYTATPIGNALNRPSAYGTMMGYANNYGDSNYTGASVGGFEVSETCALVAYNEDASTSSSVRNVKVVSYAFDGSRDPVCTEVTSYGANSSVTAFTPFLVKLDARHFLLMWAENNKQTGAYWTQLALVDLEGNLVGDIVKKMLPLSDCQPITLSDGSVAWFVSSGSETKLYTLNPYDLASMTEDNFSNKLAADISKGSISAISQQSYTGKAVKPKVKVTLGGSTLVQGVDYSVSYSNNTKPGTATVSVTGKGSYTGKLNKTFQIAWPFTDVNAKTPHVDDVLWLYTSGISTGWTMKDGTRQFRPMNTVIRQDMAAFLFREARLWGLVDDSWQPTGEVTFTDVTPSTPHYREIMWLAESGVSAGWTMPDGTRQFRPTNTVIRQDMAAFLRRMQALRDPSVGSWAPTAGSPFTDVNASTPHYEDVLWLAESGVSTGWTMKDGTKQFRPTNTVVRQDMAAFLQRLNALG